MYCLCSVFDSYFNHVNRSTSLVAIQNTDEAIHMVPFSNKKQVSYNTCKQFERNQNELMIYTATQLRKILTYYF